MNLLLNEYFFVLTLDKVILFLFPSWPKWYPIHLRTPCRPRYWQWPRPPRHRSWGPGKWSRIAESSRSLRAYRGKIIAKTRSSFATATREKVIVVILIIQNFHRIKQVRILRIEMKPVIFLLHYLQILFIFNNVTMQSVGIVCEMKAMIWFLHEVKPIGCIRLLMIFRLCWPLYC